MKNFLKGKTILITGGTGFLGKALVKKILEFEPHSIRVFSRDEVKHFRLSEEFKNPKIRNLVGDVRDCKRVKKAVKGADIVIHAAAMKRIDLIEYNVAEAIKTNVLGTMNVVEACIENNVEKAIFVSTDKACSPINSYGATKLLGERIFIESNYSRGSSKTAFIAVRYGNVIESTGSVIPFFKEQILKGKDITLTDENMTRFIITPKRAVEEILTAIELGAGGEIFVPKLESLKITDLIDVLKKHYQKNNAVKIVGLRPGEKIDELMVNEDESKRTYELENGYVILSQIERFQKKVKYGYLSSKKNVNFSRYGSSDNLMSKSKILGVLKKANVLK